MPAFVEHLVWIVRAGKDATKYRRSWEYAVTCVSVDHRTVVAKALKGDGKFKTSHARDIIRECKALGFERVVWERVK